MKLFQVGALFLFCVCTVVAGLSQIPSDLEPIAQEHKNKCSRCHGESGKGDGSASKLLKDKPADWTDSERMLKISDEEIYKIIELGGAGVSKSKLMPAFSSKLSKEQISDFVRFVRSFHSNKP